MRGQREWHGLGTEPFRCFCQRNDAASIKGDITSYAILNVIFSSELRVCDQVSSANNTVYPCEVQENTDGFKVLKTTTSTEAGSCIVDTAGILCVFSIVWTQTLK